MSTKPALLACSGLVIAPLLWALNTQLGEVLPYADCAQGVQFSVIASVPCILVACVSGWVSWHAPSRQSIGESTLRFVAKLSGPLAGVFAFALLLQAIAGVVLTGCER
jgi:hypothetical protein